MRDFDNDDSDARDQYELRKEGRRGSGRKGVQTSKTRQKRNCSRNNHGCHGYIWEKSLAKRKGCGKERSRFLVDSFPGQGFSIEYDAQSNEMRHVKISPSKAIWQ